jgi:hypothetical protein
MNQTMKRLARPFPAHLISWRAGATNKNKTPDKKPSKCIALAYIDARDVMERLDSVFGLDWQCKYSHADQKTICELSVKIDDQWITRSNGAGDSDVEAEKGAISDAFKRAGVMFGIGRYLYGLPNTWVECDEWGHIKTPPALPAWALPEYEFISIATDIKLAVEKDATQLAVDKLQEFDSDEKCILWPLLDKQTKITIIEFLKDKK